MEGSYTPRRTDVILSVATLALAIAAAGLIAATSSTDEFVAWAWARHHNILSWYVRPLFILPFCFFAYMRIYTRSIWPATIAHAVHNAAWNVLGAVTLITAAPVLVDV